jgi:Zn-dependent M16 (insulinase) family peptidase
MPHTLVPSVSSPPQAYVAVNWVLTDEPLDVETELALGFLDYLMLGTSAAPLRKVSGQSGRAPWPERGHAG